MLDKVSIDLTGWHKHEEKRSPDSAFWRNEFGDVLSLSFDQFWERDRLFDRDSWLHDVREMAKPGGIVSLEVFTIQSKPAVQFIYKRRHGLGYMYSGSLIVQSSDCNCYTFAVVCAEGSFTGVREAVITARLLQEGNLQIRMYRWYQKLFSRERASGYLEGWFYDPYDPGYSGIVLHSASDSEQFDPEFPNHPLTRLRSHLKRIRESLFFFESGDAATGQPRTN